MTFPRPHPNLRAWLKAMRVHHWAKNLLLAAPLIAAHRIGDLSAIFKVFLACLAFSLSASSGYLINDLLDLGPDRRHAVKRNRPFAAGTLSIQAGLVAAVILLVAGLALAVALLPPEFCVLLLVYITLTALYSLYLKRALLLDVFTLAALYTLRLLAGAAAVRVEPSFWLLAFSMFLFLSLAFVKRYTELSSSAAGSAAGSGRAYEPADVDMFRSIGPTCGFLSVLVFALYINSPQVAQLYPHPIALWFICPILLYWIARTWFLAQRGTMTHDPVIFALRDPVSRIAAVVVAVLLLLASR